MIRSRPGIWGHRLAAILAYWVAVPAAVLGGGHGVDRWLGLPGMGWRRTGGAVGLAVVFFGVALIARATRDLSRLGHGTPSPADPPRELVTSGAYGWCRHPMFLGYDLAALGVILAIGSWGSLVAAYPLLLWVEVRFLRHEERGLARRFGSAYLRYRESVPLLIPHPPRRR